MVDVTEYKVVTVIFLHITRRYFRRYQQVKLWHILWLQCQYLRLKVNVLLRIWLTPLSCYLRSHKMIHAIYIHVKVKTVTSMVDESKSMGIFIFIWFFSGLVQLQFIVFIFWSLIVMSGPLPNSVHRINVCRQKRQFCITLISPAAFVIVVILMSHVLVS